jgi:hypothetical protein
MPIFSPAFTSCERVGMRSGGTPATSQPHNHQSAHKPDPVVILSLSDKNRRRTSATLYRSLTHTA